MDSIINLLSAEQKAQIQWLNTALRGFGERRPDISMLIWPDFKESFIQAYSKELVNTAQQLFDEVLFLLKALNEEEKHAFSNRCPEAQRAYREGTLERLADAILEYAMNTTELDLEALIHSFEKAQQKFKILDPQLHALLTSTPDGLLEVLPEHKLGRMGVCLDPHAPSQEVQDLEALKKFSAEAHGASPPEKHLFYHPLILNFLSTEHEGFTATLAELHSKMRACRFFVAVNYHHIAQWLPESVDKAMRNGKPLDVGAILQNMPTGMTVYVPDDAHLDTQTDSRFEILWEHADDTKQQLQIQTENLKKQDRVSGEAVQTGKYVLTHYFHAIFDPNLKCFTHLDGAIKFYTPQEFQERDRKSLAADQHKNKVKLFRIDGTIPMLVFERLLELFYPGNPCVTEYLRSKAHHNPEVAR